MRGRIGILVAVGAVAVAAGLALLLNNTIALRDRSRETLRADAYSGDVVQVERLIVDAETGLRGYVITDRPLFLAPLYASQAQLPAAERALLGQAASSGQFRSQAEQLVGASRSYMSGYVVQLLATARHDIAAARTLSVTLAGKDAVDGIRARTAALETLLDRAERARQQAARREANRAIDEATAALVVLTLLVLAVSAYLGRIAVIRDRERRAAQTTTEVLQQSILPDSLPELPGIELASRFSPTGGWLVGGDFFDVFELEPGVFACLLGDVAGKGAGGAAVSAMARWTLRSVASAGAGPEAVIRALNEAMLRHGFERRFLTLAFAQVRVSNDHAEVQVACAGHPPPVLVAREGGARAVEATGDLLGVWPEVRLDAAELRLRAGDSLALYSDGVSDPGPGLAVSPEQALNDLPAPATAEQVADALDRLAGPRGHDRPDDVAVLVVRFVGRGSVAAALGPAVAASHSRA